MSLLGIDIGTTGCKAAVFSTRGECLASAYAEYDIHHPKPGYAELDTLSVWEKAKGVIAQVAAHTGRDSVTALSVSSLGEAVAPVTAERRILGPSILNFDGRGEEYLPGLASCLPHEHLYRLNGNTLGNHYGLTKLMWIRDHQPELYAQADKFLLWSSFVAFMLGAEAVVDYSLANRTLLFDIDRAGWSEELLSWSGLDSEKLPRVTPSGKVIGVVSRPIAAELGVPSNVLIVSGAHDQCANAVGCGVIEEGRAAYGMGTFLCITPVFRTRRDHPTMMAQGLNTEHHAAPGRFVSFIYNQGGSLLKWYRDTFAAAERRSAEIGGEDIYARLIAEMPAEPSRVVVLPHFTITGPPEFISDSAGVMVGLRLETRRGEILKGILEGVTFYLRQCVEALPSAGIQIDDFRAVGGGSKSDAWIQLSADILGRPFTRPKVTEAGALGAAIIAGVGSGVFASFEEGVAAMVRLERTFEPDMQQYAHYQRRFEHYTRLWPLMREYLREMAMM